MIDDPVSENPIGEIPTPDADEMHRETISSLEAGFRRIVEALTGVGAEIIRLDAGAVSQSQHIRFRVQYLIINRAVAGAAVLGIGSGTYPFTVGAVPVRVDFPIVIERGVDMTFTGDGVLYLVGYPE